MGKYYVYIHKEKKNGNVVYCGKGSNFRFQDHTSRCDEHLSMMKNNQLTYVILQHFVDEKEAYSYEEKLTEEYKKINQCRFNISIGRRTSEETKRKLSKILSGKKRTEKTRRLISKNHGKYNAKKVYLYKEGTLINKFGTSREAGKYAVDNNICSYGWRGRSLTTGEKTQPTKSYPVGSYLFVYENDIIK